MLKSLYPPFLVALLAPIVLAEDIYEPKIGIPVYDATVTKTIQKTVYVCPCDSTSNLPWYTTSSGFAYETTTTKWTTYPYTYYNTTSSPSVSTTSTYSTSSYTTPVSTTSSSTLSTAITTTTSSSTTKSTTTSSRSSSSSSTSTSSTIKSTTTSSSSSSTSSSSTSSSSTTKSTTTSSSSSSSTTSSSTTKSTTTSSSSSSSSSSTTTTTTADCRPGTTFTASNTAGAFSTIGIVPTLIPSFQPTLDVVVNYNGVEVQPGDTRSIADTARAPVLEFSAEDGYDPATTKYSYFMVDPDVPDPSSPVRQNYLHWEVYDAQPFCISSQNPQTVAAYQATTPASAAQHRYTFLVYRQPPNYTPDTVTPQTRVGFDLNTYTANAGLVLVGGNFFLQGIGDT